MSYNNDYRNSMWNNGQFNASLYCCFFSRTYGSALYNRYQKRKIVLQLSVWLREVSGAKTVPKKHANINKTGKSNENMPISAIESIGNISKNGIQIT